MNNNIINKIHNIVESKMGATDNHFMNMMIFNKLSQIATHMHINIETWDKTLVPCNFYGLSLAPSGYNKGRLNNILEDNVFKSFKKEYDEFSSTIASETMSLNAERQAAKDGISEEEAMDLLIKRWQRLPDKLYDFSDATEAGLKGAREKFTMAGIGGTCMEIDEIAYNLEKFKEVLTVLLEAYDVGKAKDKLIKIDSNSASGKIPSTLFMFGSPTSLLNGSKEENDFFAMLRQGYARRMFFSYIKDYSSKSKETAKDILNRSRISQVEESELLSYFQDIATRDWHNKTITATDDIWEQVIQYKIDCEEEALKYKEHEDIQKFELSHRYWKVLKVMGLLAIADKRDYIKLQDFQDAKLIATQSGSHFLDIVNREPNYVRLFNFMSDMGKKLTEADLYEHLYFYSNSNQSARKDMRNLASAYAYNQNGFIRETIKNGVTFYEAEVMKKTDLDKIKLSYSTDITYNYENVEVKWEELKQFFITDGLHYTVHHFKDGHRNSENLIEGFNLLVLDIDDGLSIDMVRSILNDYTYYIYTTKRHTKDKHRFRVVMPLSNIVKLNDKDYKSFMENIFAWLPFDVDSATKDCSRKWLCNAGESYSNSGIMLDPTDFIPDTSNQKEHTRKLENLSNLDNLEKFFVSQIDDGLGRNNILLKFALMLVDGGLSYENIEDRVLSLNDKLETSISVQEIMSTVMKTVRRKIGEIND